MEHSVGGLSHRSFSHRLRSLKKDFQVNVQPALRRHNHAKSKSEREREKHLRFLRKQRTRIKKIEKLRAEARKKRISGN